MAKENQEADKSANEEPTTVEGAAPEQAPPLTDTGDIISDVTPENDGFYKNGNPKPETAEIRDERKRFLETGVAVPGFGYKWNNGKLLVRKLG